MKRSPSPWSTVLGRATTTSAVAFLLAGCGAQSDTAKSPPPKEKDVTSEGPAESLPPVAMAPSETPPAAADETPPPHISRAEFDDAAYRTAQISFDLGFHGVPMMYS